MIGTALAIFFELKFNFISRLFTTNSWDSTVINDVHSLEQFTDASSILQNSKEPTLDDLSNFLDLNYSIGVLKIMDFASYYVNNNYQFTENTIGISINGLKIDPFSRTITMSTNKSDSDIWWKYGSIGINKHDVLGK